MADFLNSYLCPQLATHFNEIMGNLEPVEGSGNLIDAISLGDWPTDRWQCQLFVLSGFVARIDGHKLHPDLRL